MLGNLFGTYINLAILAVAFILVIYIVYDADRTQIRKMLAGSVMLLAAFFIAFLMYRIELKNRDGYMQTVKEGEPVTVWGRLYKKEHKNESFKYYLEDCSFQQDSQRYSCNHIIVISESDNLSIGDTMMLYGELNKFKKATNQGCFDQESYYFSQKIDFQVTLWKIKGIKRTGFSLGEKLYQLRGILSGNLAKEMSDANAGILEAIVFGEKDNLDGEVKALYQAMGIAHVLAISGLHISIIGMSLYRLLKKAGVSFFFSTIGAVTFSYLYCSMTGMAVTTQRAFGMLIIALVAGIIGRTNDTLNTLGMVLVVLLWDNPFLLSNSGIWFSIMAILGVTYVGKILQNRLGNAGGRLEKAKKNILMNVGIWLTTIPVVAFSYCEIPMYSMLINLLIVPFLPALIAFGIIGSLAGCISITIGKIILWPAELILSFYTNVCRVAEAIPGHQIIVGRHEMWRYIFYFIVLIIMVRLLQQTAKKLYFVVGFFTLMAIVFIAPNNRGDIDFIDVGQGDAIYICTSDGHNVMIDGGSTSQKQLAKCTLAPFLKYKGVRRIDYWFVSHSDEDHISGLVEMLQAGYVIDNIVISEVARNDENYNTIIELARKRKIKIVYMSTGDRVIYGKSVFTCLGPNNPSGYDDVNDNSLVLRYDDAQTSCMFAGDISEEMERCLIKRYGNTEGGLLDIDIYKVNHHGSKYSSCREWIEALSPRVAVISCGARNRYGHPHKETIERISKFGCKIFSTKENGEVRFER